MLVLHLILEDVSRHVLQQLLGVHLQGAEGAIHLAVDRCCQNVRPKKTARHAGQVIMKRKRGDLCPSVKVYSRHEPLPALGHFSRCLEAH